MRRIAVRVGAIMLLAITAACTREPLQGPGEVEFAKGGKPGKPVDEEVTLLEYWIQDGNLIHIKGQGDIDAVNPTVVHDYFFNGIRDDDYSPHYEYFHVGPPSAPVQIRADGTFQVDIPWNGERNDDDDLFPDLLVTDVGGADPFAFALYFSKNGETVDGIQPQGVIVAGENQGPNASVQSQSGTISATSYALFAGEDAAGTVWVKELTFTDVSCSPRKSKGESITLIDGTVHVLLGSDSNLPPSAWMEFHIAADGLITRGTTRDTSDGAAEFYIRGVLPGSWTEVSVQLQLDYVYPTRHTADFAYYPGTNAVSTLHRYDVIGAIGDPVPVAVTESEVVPCGH